MLLRIKRSAKPSASRRTHSDFEIPQRAVDSRAFLNGETRPPMVSMEYWQLVLLGILLLILFGAMPLHPGSTLAAYYLLCAGGLVLLVRQGLHISLNEAEITGLQVIVVFFLVSLITYWINAMPGRGHVYVEGRHGKFLLAIPVYILLRSYIIPSRFIWMLAILVSLELFFVSMANALFYTEESSLVDLRSVYYTTLTLTVFTLIIVFRDEWCLKKIPTILARIGLLAALVSLFIGKSQGAIPAALVAGMIYTVSRFEQIRIRHFLQILATLLLLCSALYQIPAVNESWNNAILGSKSAATQASGSEISHQPALFERMKMWRIASQLISENFILGIGPGGYQLELENFNKQSAGSKALPLYSGPHNQYLNAWLSRGILGLITLILLLLLPWLYCWRVRMRTEFQDIRQLTLAVMMIVAIFAVKGLSEDVLDDKNAIILFVTTLALLLGQIRHRSRY